jgi:predicted Zn-dependent protease
MKKAAILATFMVAAMADYHPITQEIIDEIRSKASTWEPMDKEQNPLSQKSYEEIRGLLGTFPDFNDVEFPDPEVANESVPELFDSREKWDKCVHPIRD